MKAVSLTYEDRMNFQYLMPIQGDINTLELADGILNKIRFKKLKEGKNIQEIKVEFSSDEMEFIRAMIKLLNERKQLAYIALPLVKKLINIKELT